MSGRGDDRIELPIVIQTGYENEEPDPEATKQLTRSRLEQQVFRVYEEWQDYGDPTSELYVKVVDLLEDLIDKIHEEGETYG